MFVHRRITFERFPHLSGQPTVTVHTEPSPGILEVPESGEHTYVRFTHIFNVTPVVKHSTALRPKAPGLVHEAPIPNSAGAQPKILAVSCSNYAEIVKQHLAYWCDEPDAHEEIARIICCAPALLGKGAT